MIVAEGLWMQTESLSRVGGLEVCVRIEALKSSLHSLKEGQVLLTL